jgi:hypothetical protein
MSRRTIALLTALAILSSAACGANNDSDASNGHDGATPGKSPGRAYGEKMVIRTTDGTMNLGLAHDTVFMGLTDSVVAAARTDMARDTEEKTSAVARTIEKFVKKSVSSALQMRLKYAVSDIDSVSYTNGSIKFKYRNKRRMGFENVDQEGHKALSSFQPDDAQRFVDELNNAILMDRGSNQ